MLHLADLLGDGSLPHFIGDAEAGDADAGAHIHIFLSGIVPHQRALAGDDLHREPVVGSRDVFPIDLLNTHA